MFNRIAHKDGLVIYQSSLLSGTGVVHAFSTRVGGVSVGPYASLNLGLSMYPQGDSSNNIEVNYRRFTSVLGCEDRIPTEVYQVHGNAVWLPPTDKSDLTPEADAIVSDQPGRLLIIRTADCCPVLIASRDGTAVAGIHAGWRGIVGGVVPKAIGCFKDKFGTEANDLVAGIGPSIGRNYYEVGPEVVKAFIDADLEEAVHDRPGGKPQIDLKDAAKRQLMQCGIGEEAIDCCDLCTYDDSQSFFSYRRDNKRTGKMANVIGVKMKVCP